MVFSESNTQHSLIGNATIAELDAVKGALFTRTVSNAQRIQTLWDAGERFTVSEITNIDLISVLLWSPDITQYFIMNQAPLYSNTDNTSVLYKAVVNLLNTVSPDAVHLLINAGLPVEDISTALLNLDCTSENMRVLIELGADINVRDEHGESPLDKKVSRHHRHYRNDDVEVIRLLLDRGAICDETMLNNHPELDDHGEQRPTHFVRRQITGSQARINASKKYWSDI